MKIIQTKFNQFVSFLKKHSIFMIISWSVNLSFFMKILDSLAFGDWNSLLFLTFTFFFCLLPAVGITNYLNETKEARKKTK